MSNPQYHDNPDRSRAGDNPRLSRRAMLVKGLGRGSAVLAAAVPIKTLASIPSVTANGKVCSTSGVQSAVHSASTNLPTCGGLSPGYYKTLTHWPNYYPGITYTVGSHTFNQNTKFSTLFGGGLNLGLMDILLNRENTEEFHWIPALLNAIKAPSGYVFPYAPQEILNLYAGPQRADALLFIKNYMETV